MIRTAAKLPVLALAMLFAACSEGADDPIAGASAHPAVAETVAVAAPMNARIDPFPGQRTVRVDELLAALAAQVEPIAGSASVRRDYERFLADQKLTGDGALYRDYVRIRLAFEATRAGGLWGLQWRITDQQPQSDRIWAQWRALEVADGAALPRSTAIAECDELSALFAYVARRLGLSRRSEVGLFWPARNHTVAAWTIDATRRVVVPTSQVFLGPADSLGTTRFDPWAQKSIHPYRREDAPPDLALPAALARQFVCTVQDHAGRTQAQLQEMRNERERQQLR
jgi:hypothetical protein